MNGQRTFIDEVRPPWSEVYRWQRRAAVSACSAVVGWAIVVVLLLLMWWTP